MAREGDHLFVRLHGQRMELYPEGTRDYFLKAFDAQITFVTDGNGRATELRFREGGKDIYATRTQ
jgi:hypothetical protein